MRELLFPASLPKPKFRYTPCVKTGPYYQMGGLIGLDPQAGGQLVGGGPLEETRQILRNVAAAARDLGLDLMNLVSATVYTTRFQEFSLINQAWEEVFTDALPPPARTSVGVAALPLGATVEIEFRFYKE